jgi:pectinesterase
MIVVAKDGSGEFINIQSAVDSIAENNLERVTIYVKKGVYKEKLYINKPFITLLGEDLKETILTYDDCGNKLMDNGETMGTFRSYSTFIGGDDFIAENITFENSAGPGKIVGQALAVYVDGDRIKFRNCRFLGSQDTIFTGPLPPQKMEGALGGGPRKEEERRKVRQYYENCYICGDVDFIFGASTAVFNKCEIFSKDRKMNVNGYITAASTPEDVNFGYVFIDCKLTSEAAPNTVFLGRPWRDYAAVTFINCWMGEHIIKEGWHNWNRPGVEEKVRYQEYGSNGPGANIDDRVKWSKILTSEEAKTYTIKNILSGKDNWEP